jgi:hypothetical protein
MPCNLAISITKACIPNEQLQVLFTPEIVATLLSSLAQEEGYTEQEGYTLASAKETSFRIAVWPNGLVECHLGGYDGITIAVRSGQVTVRAPLVSQENEVERWQALVQQVFRRAAGALVAAQLQPQLQQMYGSVSTDQVLVAAVAGEAATPVTRFTIHL